MLFAMEQSQADTDILSFVTAEKRQTLKDHLLQETEYVQKYVHLIYKQSSAQRFPSEAAEVCELIK